MLITNSASTMNKMRLDYNRYLKDREEHSTFKMKHQNVKLELIDDSLSEKFDITDLTNVQHIQISYCTLSGNDLNHIFKNLRNLKKFELLRVLYNQDQNDACEFSENEIVLKSLMLIRTDHNVSDKFFTILFLLTIHFLKIFSALRVQTHHLKIIDCDNKQNNEKLIHFLEKQKKLESLHLVVFTGISTTIEKTLFDSVMDQDFDLKFPLKKLYIVFCSDNFTSKYKANVIKFLRVFKNSLESVNLHGALGSEIYKFVFDELKFLTTLTIDANNLPTDYTCDENSKPNHNMKVLNISSIIRTSNYKSIVNIISNFPSVEKLNLSDTDSMVANDLYNMLQAKLKRLTHLTVLNFNKKFIPSGSFECLKSFTIKNLENVEQWLSFVMLHQTLETVHVGWIMRDFEATAIEKVVQLPNLQVLKFGGRFTANKRIYEIIKRDNGNLKVLELEISNYDDVQKLTFTFPCDKKLFNPKCAYFDEGHDKEPLND
jgi:hypothetical protein